MPIFRCPKILGEAGKQEIIQKMFRKFQISNRLPNRCFPKIDVAHFFVHFLATNLHEYNVKSPENFLVLTFYGGNLCGICMFLFTFSTAAHFF